MMLLEKTFLKNGSQQHCGSTETIVFDCCRSAKEIRETQVSQEPIFKWCIAPHSRDKPVPDQRSHTLDGVGTDCDVLVPSQASQQ